MPLIQSPIDGQPMRQVVRYGIEFDVCASTGGVWLDRGELEKLIAFVTEEVRAQDASASTRERYRPYEPRQGFDEDDDDRRHRGDRRGKSRLTDLFDF
ncbi:MAG: zf-TFIIB domain-containing protein [Hyphomonadaceae bacterium]|nr:zf-TFIIB domain-containing protein [Hyphomonadaceae bacterium]